MIKIKESSYILGYKYFIGLGNVAKATIEDTFQFNEESDEEYFLEDDFQYPENLRNLCIDLPFLPDRIKIEKVEKLLANLHNKTECVTCLRNLKQSLNHGLVLLKVHRVIKFNQNGRLKPYIDINTDLKKSKK